jgi:hypothetical protein
MPFDGYPPERGSATGPPDRPSPPPDPDGNFSPRIRKPKDLREGRQEAAHGQDVAPSSRWGRSPMGRPRIHVLLDDTSLTPSILKALATIGADVEIRPFGSPVCSDVQARRAQRCALFDGDATVGGRDTGRQARIRRIDDQLRLAASLQRNLRTPAPTVEGLDIHTVYRPADVISGDAYDVARLDETHVAVTVADATGHGLPAGLLSTFVRRSLRGKEFLRDGYRLLEPDEVLARANADILETRLQECQFVTATYAVYDEATRIIRWARGGAPYPILVPFGGPPMQVTSRGPLLGAIPGARFEVVEHRLDPGDTILFHTDGLDAMLLGARRDLGCCDLDRTDWYGGLGTRSIDVQLAALDRVEAASELDADRDDLTVIALQARKAIARPCETARNRIRQNAVGASI